MLAMHQLSKEAHEILTTLVMSQAEKDTLFKSVGDDLTYEKTQDLMLEILETYGFKPENNVDVMLWLTRMSYLYGFIKATDAYSTAIEMGLRDDGEESHK